MSFMRKYRANERICKQKNKKTKTEQNRTKKHGKSEEQSHY